MKLTTFKTASKIPPKAWPSVSALTYDWGNLPTTPAKVNWKKIGGGINTSVTWSKWNMDKNVCLKFYLSYLFTHTTNIFFEIPQCAQTSTEVIFGTKFVILYKNPPFYKVTQLRAWRNIKNADKMRFWTRILNLSSELTCTVVD